MRVISGSAKGKKLISTKNREIRPTSDKVKMAIFNILRHGVINFDFNGCYTLDLFSGSGSLGIESLSRGSEFCFFLDISHSSHQVCKKIFKAAALRISRRIEFGILERKNLFLSKINLISYLLTHHMEENTQKIY